MKEFNDYFEEVVKIGDKVIVINTESGLNWSKVSYSKGIIVGIKNQICEVKLNDDDAIVKRMFHKTIKI